MASEWQKLALGDLTEWSSGGTPPKSNPEFWGGDIPWISASSMKTGRLSESDRTLTPEGLKRGSRLTRKGNVLLLVRGSELHKRIPVGIAVRDVSFNQDVKALCAKNGLDKDFLYYWLAGNETMLLSKVENTGIGAGKLDTNVLKNLPVLLPPGPEQRRIAHILGTLDDKIENNRKTAKTLEAMAQAIFQSWFVDFDPVRAKMAGESKESICKRLKLTPEILDLFPDRLVDSELGEIPEGWQNPYFSELVMAKQGKYLDSEMKKSPDRDSSVPVWGGNDIIGYTTEPLYKNPVVLITCRGSNCGLIKYTKSESWVSNNSFACRPNVGSTYFLLTYLLKENFEDCITGSAQPQITYSELKKKKMKYPVQNLICEIFSDKVDDLYLEAIGLETQITYLTEIRDTILPKLISGEIRVPEAEHLIENIEG